MSVVLERLTPADVYHYLDWLAEAFQSGDQLREVEERSGGGPRLRLVFEIDRQIVRLERVLAHLSEPHHSQAMDLVAEVKQARFSERQRARIPELLLLLRGVVSDWDKARPQPQICGHKYESGSVCSIATRSPRELAEHRYRVHDGPYPEHWRQEDALLEGQA